MTVLNHMPRKKIVLSILCDGTFYNSHDKSIIGELEQAIDAHALNQGGRYNPPVVNPHTLEQHYKIYVPGPGATPNQDYGRPGEINPVTGKTKSANNHYQAKAEVKNRAGFDQAFYNEAYGLHLPEVKSSASIVKALLTGTGLRDNALYIVDCIAQLIAEPNVDWANSDVTIQIAGWSRGAVLAGIVSNMLATSLIGSHAKVTIVQVDPVGGKIRGQDFCEQEENQDCKGMGERVDRHLALLAMDDSRDEMENLAQTFLPSEDILNQEATQGVYQAIGIHGSHKNVACGNSPGAQITRHNIAKEFTAKGVKFQPEHIQFQVNTDAELIETYFQSKLQQRQHEYKLTPLKRLIFTQKQRQFLKTHDHAIRLPQYFVNSQHEAVFAENHEELYQFLLNPLVTKVELDRAKSISAESPVRFKQILELKKRYQMQDIQDCRALETLLALEKCEHLLKGIHSALSPETQQFILANLKQDYLVSHEEKALISALEMSCSIYIEQATQEIAEADKQLAEMPLQSSNIKIEQQKTELVQRKISLEQKSKNILNMRNLLQNEKLAEKNRLQLFHQEFKAKRSTFEQESSPKLRLIFSAIVERLAAAFKIFSSSETSEKQALAPTLHSIDRHLKRGIQLRR